MKFKKLTAAVKQYVVSYFDAHRDDDLSYHNLEHTKDVVASALKIAKRYQLNEEDLFTVTAGSWFHDIGYLTDREQHEITGTDIAERELALLKVEQHVIDNVKGCILATRMPQNPDGLLQEIICDADLFHLGTAEFSKNSKKLRQEIENIKGVEIDKDEWRNKNIALLGAHRYFTDYGRRSLAGQQQQNLEKLLNMQQLKKNTSPEEAPAQDAELPDINDKDEDGDGKHEKKHKTEKPEKGIETMFRISSANHQRLSDMADHKAQIMITVNSIILSAIISLVLRKIDEHSNLMWPTFLLLAVSLATMTFSILATRPSIPAGFFTREEIEKKTVNLLFFGNFYRMGLDEYSEGMFKMMDDSAFLYGSLIRDNYHQGVVLGKKYKLLRDAYNIFMYGLIIAVAAFIVAALLPPAAVIPIK